MFIFQRNGIYYMEYFDDVEKKNRRVSTGERNKAAALKFLKNFVPEKKEKNTQSQILLNDFFKEFYQFAKESLSQSYLRSIVLSSRMFINFTGNKHLRDITPREAELFISHTYARAKYSAHLYYRTLKAAFYKAVNWGHIESNPFSKIKPAKTQKKLPVFITLDELSRICEKENNAMLKILYTVAFYTGLRQSELLNLKWRDIDVDKKFLVVGNTSDFVTKSKSARMVPLNSSVIDALSNVKKGANDDYVFLNENGIKLNNDFASKRFKKAVRKSCMNDEIHFHTLRHSFASCLAQNGISLYVIKEILGHQNISTTQIYAHLNNAALFDAVNSIRG